MLNFEAETILSLQKNNVRKKHSRDGFAKNPLRPCAFTHIIIDFPVHARTNCNRPADAKGNNQ
ncbi:hypothetical protein JCM6292_2605 [Bacteroides pyogenes JCM 6292]|uniref:Uncharacterized protein n=1 Tax=Bacteroides pyogenes JCM 6292 TaxID=1235809 RepID=W4P8X5_9BACE|nr:hypothetical protein JCM6292_2605 [Bacteroides pyogenes JCM 6292]